MSLRNKNALRDWRARFETVKFELDAMKLVASEQCKTIYDYAGEYYSFSLIESRNCCSSHVVVSSIAAVAVVDHGGQVPVEVVLVVTIADGARVATALCRRPVQALSNQYGNHDQRAANNPISIGLLHRAQITNEL